MIRHLAPGASVVLYGGLGGGTDDCRLRDFYQAGAYNARVIAFISTIPDETKGEDLTILARLVDDGRLRPPDRLDRGSGYDGPAGPLVPCEDVKVTGRVELPPPLPFLSSHDSGTGSR